MPSFLSGENKYRGKRDERKDGLSAYLLARRRWIPMPRNFVPGYNSGTTRELFRAELLRSTFSAEREPSRTERNLTNALAVRAFRQFPAVYRAVSPETASAGHIPEVQA